ncbi:hypothetical protein ACIRNI_08855 [Streptomyces sp. NPDC093546]|uniref:hypothetical protein n=1 Tax=Streptomyces sp. NPDC093546 TaxID=3366040 RepID=UPI0038287453
MAMEFPTYPGSDVLLARLARSQDMELPPTSMGKPPTEKFLHRLAEQIGMQSHDLFLIAGLSIPDQAWPFDEGASRELPRLVRHALPLPASSRQQLRDYARPLTERPMTASPRKRHSYEQYPPCFGSLFVRMLALRNLGWSSAAKVMYLMSDVYLSAATIGAVGRGVKELDRELLNGFAAVFGVRVSVLATLTGMQDVPPSRGLPGEIADTAALLWDVRHLPAAQVRQVSQHARALSRS